MNYVSFSCYGSRDIYLCGALENAKLLPRIYPDWRGVFYLDATSHALIGQSLEDIGALVVPRNHSEGHAGMLWRFEAVRLPRAQRVIFRDTDSRVSFREATAVKEWVQSGASLHVMRDHPWHTMPVMGGMWGIQGTDSLTLVSKKLLELTSARREYGEDQDWVSSVATKLFWDSKLVHDSFPLPGEKAHRFSPRDRGEFIGERIDCNGSPEYETRDSLAKFELNPLRRLHRKLTTKRFE